MQEAPEMDLARLLDDQVLRHYTNPAFLPGAEPHQHSAQEVLQRRLAPDDQPLRTLCARYSQQHVLAAATLADRGLFAQLTLVEGRPAFFSPAQWALWLGAVRPLVLPPTLEDVFHGLGNCISVPQAAIPWTVFLSAVGLIAEVPEHLVLRVWRHRLRGVALRPAVVDFAFHPQAPVRADAEGPPIVVGEEAFPRMVFPYRMGAARSTLHSPSGFSVEVTYPVGASVSLVLLAARLPPVVLPLLAVSTFARVWLPRESAGDLTGHDLAVVPAQEPGQLAPQPPPPVLVPPEVRVFIHDPMRREHVLHVPRVATLRQLIWALPLPDRLLMHVRPYVQGRPVSDTTTAENLAGQHVLLRLFPLPGGGFGSSETAVSLASDDDEMVPVDPLTMHDPWAPPPGLVPTAKSAPAGPRKGHAKWDQLLLPEDHAFTLADLAVAPVLVPHGQLGPLVSGLAFCPVSLIAETLKAPVTAPTALIVPGTSRASLPALPSAVGVEGPLQISVLDPVAALTYKRQVVLVHLAPGITYRPSVEDATVIATVDFVELVVESFEALATDFAGILAKSAADLRALLEAPHQSSVVQSVYALRVLHGSVHNLGRVVQFTVKLPLTHRLAFLRLSGTGPFFVRDFLAQGADPQDHSVVHRFWPLSVEGLRAALAVSRALEGFAGLAPLKRGVTVRVLHSHIADARRALLQEDPRFVEANRSLVPRVTFLAEGLPFGATPGAIVEAVLKAVGAPCIPLRSFRRNGILVWVLAFAQAALMDFTLLSAGRPCEVILAPEPPPQARKARPKGGRTPQSLPSAPLPLGLLLLVLPRRDSSLGLRPSSNDWGGLRLSRTPSRTRLTPSLRRFPPTLTRILGAVSSSHGGLTIWANMALLGDGSLRDPLCLGFWYWQLLPSFLLVYCALSCYYLVAVAVPCF